MTDWVRETLDELTREEKASLLAGADLWHTVAIPRAGVPVLKVTDGPRGARGADGNHGPTSTSYPCGSALGATWDRELLEELGRALAHETMTKGAHVLLGPTVNIPRAPNAGRNFECFSEDPLLSGVLASAWISGIQAEGVSACIKHFVCNDQETDRYEIDAVVDERALREIYLEPFRIAIEASRPWAVMSAYNSVNGTTASEHPMLDQVLRGEFGFDGLVVSDWYGTYGPGVLSSGLDLEMPGPGRWLAAPTVLAAVESGQIVGEVVDRRVERLLMLIERTGAQDRNELAEHAEERSEDRALARRLATDSIVLLSNNGTLPVDPPKRIAVIGELASDTPHQGGGSSTVNAHRVVSVLDGIQAAVGQDVEVAYEPGCRVRRSAPPIESASLVGGSLRVEYFTGPEPGGVPMRSVDSDRSFLSFFGTGDEWVDYDEFSVRVTGRLVALQAGRHELSVTAGGRLRVTVSGQLVGDEWGDSNADETSAVVELAEGEEVDFVIDYGSLPGETWRWLGWGWVTPGPGPSIDAAATVAGSADLAVVVVGLSDQWESEGFDRPDLLLPGDQNALVAAVAAGQPNTVVVVTAGSPVEMPWLPDVAGVILAWYGGQEVGHAVADVLFGRAEPAGRLPVTFPVDSQQHPGLVGFPGVDGQVVYGDGVYAGYRGFDRDGLEPLFPFGHGLSYSTFTAEVASSEVGSESVLVEIDVTNTGTRDGVEVVQVYAHGIGGVSRRLTGFAKVRLAPGQTARVTVDIPFQRLRWWDPALPGWRQPDGVVELTVRGVFGTTPVPPIEITRG